MDRLYAVSLEDFVGERTRLSRELRKGGDRPAATEIAKLAKPSAAAWALNHVAREDPSALGEWLDATRALRDASSSPKAGGGDALRTAMKEHRSASTRLLTVVRERAKPSGRGLSDAMLDRVRTVLQAAASDPGIAEDLRAGRVDEARDPTPAEPAAPEPEPDETAKARKAPKKASKPRKKAEPAARAPKRDREAEARAARRADIERRVSAAAEELERLHEEASRLAAAAQAADERLEDARRGLRRLESEAGAARQAECDAAASVATAESELQTLRSRL